MEGITVPTAFMRIMYDGFNTACKTLRNSTETQLTQNNSMTRDKMTVPDRASQPQPSVGKSEQWSPCCIPDN